MSAFEPKQFGKYFLLQKIAMGGMAEIYKAKTFGVDGFEKELCIKRILPHCSADKDFITMLVDEAKLSVLLSHANIVQVYDLGKVGDDYFISMEFIHGVNLRELINRGRDTKQQTPEDIAVYISSEICKGLDYAHRKTDTKNHPLNIVHRDISPQNVLLSYEGEVKIVDFGIAKAAMNISHTMAGILKGKIAYMSPEQAMGKSIDNRTDIFSTGILLYESLTGKKLFTGESQFEVLKKIRTTRVTPETFGDEVPEPLRPILAKALAYEVEDRYQSAGDFQIALTRYLYTTHPDFSPRKLAQFIHDVFNAELQEEQIEDVRETAHEQQTSSMNVAEGAKQQEIVHRDTPMPDFDTDKARAPEEAFLETMAAQKATGAPREAITESRTMRRRRWRLPVAIAAIVAATAAGLAAWRFAPQIRSLFAPSPAPQAAELGSIAVASVPDGASILLDGRTTGEKTPGVLRNLAVGKSYVVRVEKEGLSPAEQEVKVEKAGQVDVSLTLPPLAGVLNIITDPSGAAIMIDGKLRKETTPASIESLPLNTDIRVTLSKPDFEDFEQTVTLTSNKPQRISTALKKVAPEGGKLVITSTPSGAAIRLDGKETERTTPATLANLDPGRYRVTLSLDGYEEWSDRFAVASQESVPVDAKLAKVPEKPPVTEEKPAEKKTGSLRITSTPSGAAISIDNKRTGRTTPATIPDLTIGATYRIALTKDGYERASRREVLRNAEESVAITLKEKTATPEPAPAPTPEPAPAPAPTPEPAPTGGTGKIKITSEPSGADVFLNAEFKGKTPLTASVPAGTVSVLVNKEGQLRHSQRVTVKPGQTLNLGKITLGDLYGEVSLSSTPPRAQVVFDGQNVPPTPVVVRKVRRDRDHTVTVTMPGYQPWSRTFRMDDSKKSFNIVLQPQ